MTDNLFTMKKQNERIKQTSNYLNENDGKSGADKGYLIPLKCFKKSFTFIYILGGGVESSFSTPYTYFAFQQRRNQIPFKHL